MSGKYELLHRSLTCLLGSFLEDKVATQVIRVPDVISLWPVFTLASG